MKRPYITPTLKTKQLELQHNMLAGSGGASCGGSDYGWDDAKIDDLDEWDTW